MDPLPRPVRTLATPSSNSRTITVTSADDAQQALPDRTNISASGTLRLRATADVLPSAEQADTGTRRIQWAEDVVDNEGMGKKSSKVCCIYHKPREVGESSSEDDSSSDSSSNSDSEMSDDGSARPSQHINRQHNHNHNHSHNHHDRGSCSSPSTQLRRSESKEKARPGRKRSPNAYEKMSRNS